MDLQTISAQMKIVIQKHQIVVTEMRKDPQNPVLQKRLHDLQLEIHTLNERQKQVVEGLRKNFGQTQPSSSPAATNAASGLSSACSSPHLRPHQDSKMVCAHKSTVANHKVPNTAMVNKSLVKNANASHPSAPASLNNISTPTATITFKSPVGTVVLPNCSSGGALLSQKAVADHGKMHPVLVVPSPSSRCVDGSQTGVLLNLVPPIRVPQYPPSGASRMHSSLNCQRSSVTNSTSSGSMASACNSKAEENTSQNTAISSSFNEKSRSSLSPPTKTVPKIDPKKLEFITALGLVSRDSLCEMKSKKCERKRRSTANPQFSNAALEEKWRNAAGSSQKRPRGRPRLEMKPATVPPNGLPSITDSFKTDSSPHPPSPLTDIVTAPNCLSESLPENNASVALVNGVHKFSLSEDAKNVEQLLSGLCIVCTQPGDLVKCDTCATQQHLGCMQPPLVAKPQGPWQCNECRSRTVSLTVVQSFEDLKATKEDEKRKLLKQSLELRLKRSQLEGRLLQLKEHSGKQKTRQSELQTTVKTVEQRVERIHNVVKMCS